MWPRRDSEPGCESNKSEYCSSNTTCRPLQTASLHHHLSQDDDEDGGIPIGLVKPSPSSHRTCLRTPASPHSSGHWNMAPISMGAQSSLDIKEHQPIRRSSSFTKLSSGSDKSSNWTSISNYSPGAQGSLDRGLLHSYRKKNQSSNMDLYLSLSSSMTSSSFLQKSPGSSPGYQFSHSSRSSAHSSPAKQNSLDLNHSTEPSLMGRQVCGISLDSPLGQNFDRDSPIQAAFRTQMWLTEQMEHRSNVEAGHGEVSRTEGCGVDGFSSWHQEPGLHQTTMMTGSSLPVDVLLKVKEGLLRQRELEINRQKLQILQLHARIRENELRTQQVLQNHRGLFDDPLILNVQESAVRTLCKLPSDRVCCDEELGRKLAVAELEVLYLNKFFKQITQRYTEDMKKLEEKIKTRDRYITSLKKKCQRESEENQEKQQRIETLETYLCDLPSLDEVQVQSKQQEEFQLKAKDLKKTVFQLKKNIEEGCALLQGKDNMIELQAQREKELKESVCNLQKKVQQCLDDGVRWPMQDLKRLEVENSELLQQQDLSSRLLKLQKEEIQRLSSRLMDKSLLAHLSSEVRISEVDRLLREMSLVLLDLQGLCSILAQRAQGKQPNPSVLLAMKSFSVPADEGGATDDGGGDELSFKLLQVSRLRTDINELRTTISDRYLHNLGENWAT
ncbi:centrosomal protein of 85 kDa-like isoform X2 [Kryptolebias marmoratus]|uniref:centrosomal protein of 85 kDa-like isoform X2 n=1 Tax=Kryptolebias marmoratus TaxID=37003 RepID=UPI0007F88318|nr:centrosomal protein of 85 kDa-like isoform X2 [Kryptolebias marmoratus]